MEDIISDGEPNFRSLGQNRIYSRLIARLRTASDAAAIAPGEYARIKFDYIAEIFSIKAMIDASQKNLELANADLTHKEGLNIDKSQAVLNTGIAAFAMISVLLEAPSFWHAINDLINAETGNDKGTEKAAGIPQLLHNNLDYFSAFINIVCFSGFVTSIVLLVFVNRKRLRLGWRRRQENRKAKRSRCEVVRRKERARSWETAVVLRNDIEYRLYRRIRDRCKNPEENAAFSGGSFELLGGVSVELEKSCEGTGADRYRLQRGDSSILIRVHKFQDRVGGLVEVLGLGDCKEQIDEFEPSTFSCADREQWYKAVDEMLEPKFND